VAATGAAAIQAARTNAAVLQDPAASDRRGAADRRRVPHLFHQRALGQQGTAPVLPARGDAFAVIPAFEEERVREQLPRELVGNLQICVRQETEIRLRWLHRA
jgi:hypothetical protein